VVLLLRSKTAEWESILARLAPRQQAILAAAQVRRPDQLYSLLHNFPSLSELGFDLPTLSSRALQVSRDTSLRILGIGGPGGEVSERCYFGAAYPAGAQAPPGFSIPIPEDDDETDPRSGPRVDTQDTGFDLRPAVAWPIKNQGSRGTCVAHALVASREHRELARGANPLHLDLSEQFLFWAAKNQPGEPDPSSDATFLEFAHRALAVEGVCREESWPYVPHVYEGNVTHAGPENPSAAARDEAIQYRAPASRYAVSGRAAELLQILSRGCVAAISLPVFCDRLTRTATNWDAPISVAYGEVLDPPPTAVVMAGHAVCITGFAPDPGESQGGYFVFRNSWGTERFGRRLPAAGWHGREAGYGQVSASYVDRFLWELCVL
jgi:hypothetical protein